MAKADRTISGRYGGLAEAAAYLGKTDKAVRKLVERRAVPFRRAGKRLVFDLEELDLWVASLPGVAVEEAVTRCLGQIPIQGNAPLDGRGAR